MRIVLGNDVHALGISERDVLCMLKAVGYIPLVGMYTLWTVEEARLLVQRATAAEKEKKRVVARWEAILAMFN